jgi:hypothetical protein
MKGGVYHWDEPDGVRATEAGELAVERVDKVLLRPRLAVRRVLSEDLEIHGHQS